MNNQYQQVQLAEEVEENMNVQFRPLPVEPWVQRSPNEPAPAAPAGKIVGAFTKADHDTEYYDRVVPT